LPDFKPLYRHSFEEARRLDELDQWKESFAENIRCRQFIDEQISQGFHDNHLDSGIAKRVVDEFGFDRTMWIFANHIQHYDYDGRFSSQNKAWAEGFFIPRPTEMERRRDPSLRDPGTNYLINSHNTLVDAVAGHVRKLYGGLNLYDQRHSVSGSAQGNYAGKILILKDTALNEASRTPENQLFLAEYGNGCNPSAIGRSVFGRFLIDGEKAAFDRSDFIGIPDDRCVPDWARDKAVEMQSDDAPDEGSSMPGMKGM